MNIPCDDYILLSLINTKLRDEYQSLDTLCEEEGIDKEEVVSRLKRAGYEYDATAKAFK